MQVRLAEKHDIGHIVRMAAANVAETLPGEAFAPELVEETFVRYLMRANPTFWVAERDGEIAGFMQAYMFTYDYRAGLYTTQKVIYVSPEHRGTRAAVLLIKELIRWSEALGADRVEGGNDNSFQSERTARFLGHFGFEKVGYAMRKELRSASDGRQERR